MRHVLIGCALLIVAASASTAQDAATPLMTGGPSTYVAKNGDTIAALAARFGVTAASIVERNNLTRRDRITPGQSVVIDNSHLASVHPLVEITINVPQRMLFFMRDGRVSAYPITVGSRDWPTPLGPFTIVDKEQDPVWDVPVSIQQEMAQQGKPVITRMPPSPDNPLGAHWLRLSMPGLGIHGTNAPSSIYRYASHGCIRMHPDDVAALFDQVEIGTAGVVIYQPVVLAAVDGRVWLEAHADPYRRAPNALLFVKQEAARTLMEDRIDWSLVTEVLSARAGRPVDVSRRE